MDSVILHISCTLGPSPATYPVGGSPRGAKEGWTLCRIHPLPCVTLSLERITFPLWPFFLSICKVKGGLCRGSFHSFLNLF